MKLTRKQLNEATLRLPDPWRVTRGEISSVVQVPVFESMQPIYERHSGELAESTVKILTFRFEPREMDWVLQNFEL